MGLTLWPPLVLSLETFCHSFCRRSSPALDWTKRTPALAAAAEAGTGAVEKMKVRARLMR